jgi:HSP20 family molecular chaperone IbpA
MEIDSGPFCREIKLPTPIDVDGIRATYREGLLWIHAAKQTT